METQKYRRAVFIVTYARAKAKNKIYYLILKRKLHWKGWEFPKGGVKFFETRKHAIRREVKEETGLFPLKIKKFGVSGKYRYDKEYKDRPRIIGQTYSLYAVEIPKKKIRIDKVEHSLYKWVNFKEALKKLTYANQRKCMRVVDKWVKREFIE